MISEERLKEIQALPSRRDLTESSDQEGNYQVGKLMADAIRELLEDRRSLRKAAEIGAKNMRLWIQEGCGCAGDGHVCGIRRVQRELETVEKALVEKKCPSTYTHSNRGKLKCEKDEGHLHRIGDVEHTRNGVKWMSV